MHLSERIDKFIRENGGNARDALNIALARLDAKTEAYDSLLSRYVSTSRDPADLARDYNDAAEYAEQPTEYDPT
jgi:hypothetical protein